MTSEERERKMFEEARAARRAAEDLTAEAETYAKLRWASNYSCTCSPTIHRMDCLVHGEAL